MNVQIFELFQVLRQRHRSPEPRQFPVFYLIIQNSHTREYETHMKLFIRICNPAELRAIEFTAGLQIRQDGVPENHRTPEVCLQAVMSNRHADEFLPEWTNKEYNIYDFYHSFKNEDLIAEYLSFEQIQKVFQGETVHISGLRFAKNATFKELIIDFERNTNRINVKSNLHSIIHNLTLRK